MVRRLGEAVDEAGGKVCWRGEDEGFEKGDGRLDVHGGFLDRGDGLIFGGAIAYYWIMHFVVGLL